MAFRADEASQNGYEMAKNYLIPKDFSMIEKANSEDVLYDIVAQYGAVIHSYPSWHPLVTHHDSRHPVTLPGQECGYEGLDHKCYFVNAFITCPYDDGQKIFDSIEKFPDNEVATISAKKLDVKFYHPDANPILVCCDWQKQIPYSNMIPASLAVPLMLQKEVPCWEWASRAETWETMRPYFLGKPHGKRSSLFVNQETALTMKKVWELLINTGMFGPIKVSNQF